ncbi:MAG: hypothetical protein R6X12_08855 [bacterium]
MRHLAALLLLAFALGGCRRNTGPPTITAFEGPTEVNSGDTATFECRAWDWYLEPITFAWTASRGRVIEQATGPTVTYSVARWAAPESAGTAVVRVAVIDLDSMVTGESLAVRVKAVTRTVLNLDGLLKAGELRAWSDSLSYGHRVRGRFEVDTGRVTLRLLDAANYRRWAAGESHEPLFISEQAKFDSIKAMVPASGRHHVVLDNRSGKVDQQFQLRLVTISP